MSDKKRILILRSTDHIFDRTDYKSYKSEKGVNIGNKLWLMGLISTISGPDCTIDFKDRDLDPGYINENYDMCIKPAANLFGTTYGHYLDSNVKTYSGVKIPIHVIAVGAQADSYDELDDLAERIKPSAVRFIELIDKTGGKFALRGRFTEALFKHYGYNKAFVTGCPSLFQLGSIRIDKKQLEKSELLTAFNGNLKFCYDYLIKKHNSGEYFDQSIFYDVICGDIQSYDYTSLVKKYGLYGARLLVNKKVQLLIDMPDWMNYLKTQGYNFAFGTRIHGNIMPILSGIPALVVPPDARVREMCEFFDIPTLSFKKAKNRDLMDLYQLTDYSKFNSGFVKRLQYYKDFLKSIGITYSPDNIFFKDVIKNEYTMQSGFDSYKTKVESIKVKKSADVFFSVKECEKKIIGKFSKH